MSGIRLERRPGRRARRDAQRVTAVVLRPGPVSHRSRDGTVELMLSQRIGPDVVEWVVRAMAAADLSPDVVVAATIGAADITFETVTSDPTTRRPRFATVTVPTGGGS